MTYHNNHNKKIQHKKIYRKNSQKKVQKNRSQKFTEKVLAVSFMLMLVLPLLALPVRSMILLAQNTQTSVITNNSSTAGNNLQSTTFERPKNNSTSNSATNVETSEQVMPILDEEFDEVLENKRGKTARFFNQIKAEITSNQQEALAINKNVADTESKLKDTQAKVNSLSEQLKNLDKQIGVTESMVKNVTEQISRKEAEITKLYYEIDIKKKEISFQKEMLLEYLAMLYKQQNSISNIQDFEQKINSIKLVLGDETAGEALQAIRYSEILEETGREIFTTLEKLIEEQKNNQQVLEVKRRNLTLLSKQLQEQKEQLDIQRRAKASLLEQTKGQEKIYQELLEESKRQQAQVLEEIEALRKNLAFIQTKMKTLGDKFNPDDYAGMIQDSQSKAVYQYLTSAGGDNDELSLHWPISPIKGISAYFRDQDYVKVIGMQHNAIDVRTPQGTPLRAPADGIVYKAQDNGYGYSYIILAHGNGFMTVFGHVSEIRVEVGEMIKTGDVIGLSGATPGTRGAGVYTTGPHLHFEVLKGGKYVDPLEYLNLAYLPLETLPEKYLARAIGDRTKVKRVKDEGTMIEGNLTTNVEINGALESAAGAIGE